MTAPSSRTPSKPNAPQTSSSAKATGTAARVASAERGGFLHGLGQVFGRSLFPFVALALIAGTMLWGPWVTLVLTLVWWNVVTRVA